MVDYSESFLFQLKTFGKNETVLRCKIAVHYFQWHENKSKTQTQNPVIRIQSISRYVRSWSTITFFHEKKNWSSLFKSWGHRVQPVACLIWREEWKNRMKLKCINAKLLFLSILFAALLFPCFDILLFDTETRGHEKCCYYLYYPENLRFSMHRSCSQSMYKGLMNSLC